MKKFVSALAFFLVSAFGLASSFSDVEKSVFLLYQKNASGDMKFSCTATSIGNEQHKLILRQVTFYLTADSDENPSYVKADVEYFGDEDAGFDFAMLTSKLEAPAVKIGDERKCVPGEDVFNISGAAGFGRQFFKGYVSTISLDRPLVDLEHHINWRGFIGLILHSAGGASGSAVFNRSGELIGTITGTWNGTFTVACPASRISDFMKKGEAKKKD